MRGIVATLRAWRPGITAKLFLAIFAMCAATAIGMGLAARWSFQSGFLDYLTQVEHERVAGLAKELAVTYAREGHWDDLRDPRNWRRLISRYAGQNAAPPAAGDWPPLPPHGNQTGNQTQPPRASDIPPPQPEDFSRPPRYRDGPDSSPNADRQSGPRGMRGPEPLKDPVERARRDWETAQLRSTVGLLEANKITLIAGIAPTDGASWFPITIGEETIGWLTSAPLTGITDEIDMRFQEQQRRGLIGMMVAGLLLAAAAAMLLANTLIAPLRRFGGVTSRLASGDFSARVSPAPPLPGPLPHHNGVPKPDELQLLAAQINHLGEVLENNEHARRAFMAEIAHDLRTPLAVLRGEIEAMEDGVRPMTCENLASLHAEVALLGRLVDDIRTLSLADLGILTYDMQPQDATQCLAAAATALGDRIAAKGLELELVLPETPVPVMADTQRLAQVLRNVLENSLRYTDAGGRIQAACSIDNGQAVIDIQDSYPAVPDAQLPLLFERFHTGDAARSRASSGSGLGLAICKTLMEAQGGSISAHASALGGLWVRIRFQKDMK